MLFLGIGLLLLALKLLDIAPVVGWDWWVVLLPFALAVVWWWWADSSGYTKRRAMDQADRRKKARQEKHMDALGLRIRKKGPRR